MVLKKSKDHWAFLDEIEAPMWVDLTLEDAKYNGQCIDDEWFHTSHPFHRYSSRQLKAAFSCSGEGSYDSDFEELGPSSPNLPSSVSRSRGKDFKSKKWRGDNCEVSLNKSHLVKVLKEKSTVDVGTVKKIKSKSSFVKPKFMGVYSKSCKEIKPKLSFINSKETSSSERSLVCEGSSSQDAIGNSLKPISSSRGFESSSSSAADKANESNTVSTVTSESSLRGQKNLIEVSSQAFGQSSMLLSAVRITLRKSCVTRQASRVESTNGKRQSMMGINNDRRESRMEIAGDRRESRDRKSSSSKSSVGSSSAPSVVVNSSAFISTRKREKTRDSRNVTRMTEAPSNQVKASNVSKVSMAQNNKGNFKSRRENTPDSRNVARMTEAPSNRVKTSNVFKVSTVQNNKGNFNSRRENITMITKSTYKDTTKLQVQSSPPLRVNKQNSIVSDTKLRGKVGGSGLNRLVAEGKENAVRILSNSQKCSGRAYASGGVGNNRMYHRGVTRVLAGQQGKISYRSEGPSKMTKQQNVSVNRM